ncbi:hypothetical protein KC367_g8995 [Hortaea werneckii]|uniref:CBS domain-containing protein n=2 Tax=Hortaea werneckii TaxID=91943 RepID=A0A3M7IIF1_HORWE|nr:hypothetical protein KC342_g5965 [Hortaea werneckii]OTA32208.1 hypothetical protein BTJ68_06202 [Hortaea werneckii EXF-2000]KAI6841141.1 hypothetical protein KC350_g5321 [Hortaea werneckii]KAI6847154.1 hypothetical protein KC358_g2474 [Hortaea werneckii]KAI6938064.1 hypothetical protein KC341_g5161 [Hortaea werneckii]
MSKTTAPPSQLPPSNQTSSPWANKYRGATVEDLDPPPALSTSPTSPIQHALMAAFEREYTHLTVISPTTKTLLGYLSIPSLRSQLETGLVTESEPVEKAMLRFQRRGKKYRLITMETGLEELEAFFEGEWEGMAGQKQEFAVVTDPGRRFVLGVVTREDLGEFVRRRPA